MAYGLVTANQLIDGNLIANVFAFDNIPETQSDVDLFAATFAADWTTHVAGGMSTQWELPSIDVSVLDSTSVLYTLSHTYGANKPVGVQTEDLIPPQAALLVSTSHNGAAPNRGRTYFAGFTEASIVANGRWSGSLQTSCRDLINDLVTGVEWGSSTSHLVIMRRPSATFPAYVANTIDGVKSVGSAATIRGRRFPTA